MLQGGNNSRVKVPAKFISQSQCKQMMGISIALIQFSYVLQPN